MSAFEKVEDLAAQVKDYLNTRISLVKLQLAAKASKVISNLIASLIVFLVMMMFLIFAGIAAALALSAWIGPLYSGFLIMAAVFFLIGLFVWKKRESLLRIPIMNSIISQLSPEVEEDQ
jgi:hypothetical protein